MTEEQEPKKYDIYEIDYRKIEDFEDLMKVMIELQGGNYSVRFVDNENTNYIKSNKFLLSKLKQIQKKEED